MAAVAPSSQDTNAPPGRLRCSDRLRAEIAEYRFNNPKWAITLM
jgi:hypothetical protein